MNAEPTSAHSLPFSDAARRLLADGRAESERLRHEFVGTEHLVLALTRPDEREAIAPLGVDADQVREFIDAKVVPGQESRPREDERPFTSRTKTAIDFAADCARKLGHKEVGVVHLIVGVMRERANFGAQVLQHYGLSEERALDLAKRLGPDGTGT